MARKQQKNRMSPRMLVAYERQLKALELRQKGFTYEAIASALDYANPMGAWCAVRAALKKGFVAAAEELRAIEEEKLDAMERKLWPLVLDRRQPDLAASDRLLAIMKRRAALLGLNAPKVSQVAQASVTADVTETLSHDERVIRLSALLEEERARRMGAGRGAEVVTDSQPPPEAPPTSTSPQPAPKQGDGPALPTRGGAPPAPPTKGNGKAPRVLKFW
jgi:hypothetical protein